MCFQNDSPDLEISWGPPVSLSSARIATKENHEVTTWYSLGESSLFKPLVLTRSTVLVDVDNLLPMKEGVLFPNIQPLFLVEIHTFGKIVNLRRQPRLPRWPPYCCAWNLRRAPLVDIDSRPFRSGMHRIALGMSAHTISVWLESRCCRRITFIAEHKKDREKKTAKKTKKNQRKKRIKNTTAPWTPCGAIPQWVNWLTSRLLLVARWWWPLFVAPFIALIRNYSLLVGIPDSQAHKIFALEPKDKKTRKKNKNKIALYFSSGTLKEETCNRQLPESMGTLTIYSPYRGEYLSVCIALFVGRQNLIFRKAACPTS